MNRIKSMISLMLVFALASIGVSAQTSRRYSRTRDVQVQQLINRIEIRTNTFRNSLSAALQQSNVNGTRAEDNAILIINNLQDAVRQFHDRLNQRAATASDAQEVINRAARIDTFMQRRQLNTRAQQDWLNLRADLNQLAGIYNVTWPQTNFPSDNQGDYGQGSYGNSGQYGQGSYGNSGQGNYGNYGTSRLTGTYRLDTTRSDDPRDAANRATNTLPIQDRQRVQDNLTARLESPDQIAIDRRGRTVTIASTRAPQISFEADGRESVEQTNSGRTVRARATLNGDMLTVTTTGNSGNDYTVTFNPIDNGQRLSVTRRLINDRLPRPVVVQSIYERTSDVAQFDIYNGSQNFPTTGTNNNGPINGNGDFAVPNGTTMVAVLNESLSTARAQNGDRFTMTVRDPSQYDGATIEGHITGISRSGRITGRSALTLNFDTIRLRNGQSYRFAGLVQSVRATSGENVRVDTEGTVQEGDNRTTTTEKRAAVGTAVGAIIGAIAGGGKGAAIGAILGAGTGAGSVYVQGRDDLELTSGTEVTIQATGPR